MAEIEKTAAPAADLWDDHPIDITEDANKIWSFANKLRGSYMPDKYGDVILPMTIIRRFECTLAETKDAVLAQVKKNPKSTPMRLRGVSRFPFYCTSPFTLEELCNDTGHIKENFEAYIAGFSENIQDILQQLDFAQHIGKMYKDGCLYNIVKAFSEYDLSPAHFDPIKMGYIFENLIGRFYQNVDAGQFYTGRDIIKLLVSVLTAEGCDDLTVPNKVIDICDQACGTGGMLFTAHAYLKHINPSAIITLYGQEIMGPSYAVGLAEMLIKGQNSDNFCHADTLKNDCTPGKKMRFLIENPPFGTPWAGSDAKVGQERAVREEHDKGGDGRFPAGLPGASDAQLLFLQSAVAKLDPTCGRAAIISNGSPLFAGGVGSGESQIRRWLLEEDILDTIIAMPTDLFYNTGIATYVWILTKNKRPERRGKIQLIDATAICHKLRKPLGNKKNEFAAADRAAITKLYTDFVENEQSQIHSAREFLYREYTVMQPLQRSYGIDDERIARMLEKKSLATLYDETLFAKYEGAQENEIKESDRKKMERQREDKPIYEMILSKLHANKGDARYLHPDDFAPVIDALFPRDDFPGIKTAAWKKLKEKIMHGLSVMDKTAIIRRDTNGEILYDPETKDTEIVNIDEPIDVYMAREVLPHVPDAKAFFEENLFAATPVIKTGAELPFTRCFYRYEAPRPSAELLQEFQDLENTIATRIAKLVKV